MMREQDVWKKTFSGHHHNEYLRGDRGSGVDVEWMWRWEDGGTSRLS